MAEQRAKSLAERYYEAFKKSYSKLKDALPIDALLPSFFEAGAVPGHLKEKLKSIPVRSDKVICLLDEMELGLKVEITDQFESFICVMEKFGEEHNSIVVKRLADGIRLILSEPAIQHSSTDKIPGRYLCSFVNLLCWGGGAHDSSPRSSQGRIK